MLGLVIAPIFELSLRQSLVMSNGNWMIFFAAADSGDAVRICALLVASAMSFFSSKDWRGKLAEAEAGERKARWLRRA